MRVSHGLKDAAEKHVLDRQMQQQLYARAHAHNTRFYKHSFVNERFPAYYGEQVFIRSTGPEHGLIRFTVS